MGLLTDLYFPTRGSGGKKEGAPENSPEKGEEKRDIRSPLVRSERKKKDKVHKKCSFEKGRGTKGGFSLEGRMRTTVPSISVKE